MGTNQCLYNLQFAELHLQREMYNRPIAKCKPAVTLPIGLWTIVLKFGILWLSSLWFSGAKCDHIWIGGWGLSICASQS